MERLSPEQVLIRSALELESMPESSKPKRRRTLNKEEAMLPQLSPKAGTALRMHSVPEFHWPDDATPADITKHTLDRTFALENMLALYKEYVFTIQLKLFLK